MIRCNTVIQCLASGADKAILKREFPQLRIKGMVPNYMSPFECNDHKKGEFQPTRTPIPPEPATEHDFINKYGSNMLTRKQ